MRRMLTAFIILLFLLSAGCGKSDDDNMLTVVSTIFPGYDFAREIAGDAAVVSILAPPGSDGHDYYPDEQQLREIMSGDIFIYVGDEPWLPEVLPALGEDTTAVSMMQAVTLLPVEYKEGMKRDLGHTHSSGNSSVMTEDIEDRSLSAWSGQWQTVELALESGALEAYISQKAQGSAADADDVRAHLAQMWKSAMTYIEITDEGVSFDGIYGEYEYIGYINVQVDSPGVWYGFESSSEGVPRYIAITDHGRMTGDTPHFHLRYGNGGFDALISLQENAAMFFPADSAGQEIAQAVFDTDYSGGGQVYDSHVWTSPRRAVEIVSAISTALCDANADNAEVYKANTDAYTARLLELDGEILQVVSAAEQNVILFENPFPFRYFTEDYGLDYYAGQSGCTGEATFDVESVAFLTAKVQELQLPVVMSIEFSNRREAGVICQNTDATAMLFHSCHTISQAQLEDGVGYIDLMRQNLETLEAALNR